MFFLFLEDFLEFFFLVGDLLGKINFKADLADFVSGS